MKIPENNRKSCPFFLLTISAVVVLGVFFLKTEVGYSWGGGHDFIAEMLGNHLPANLRSFFSEENKKELIQWSHYPDMPYKDPKQIEEIVGKRDVDLMLRHGLKNSGWLHSNKGQICSLAGLVLAFREKNSRRAAFYISVLSHSISDEGALNHTPMNNYLQCITFENLAPIPYSQLKDVSMNPSDLGSCDPVAKKRINDNIQQYCPKILADNFTDFLFAVMMTEGDAGALASHVEEAVTYARNPEEWIKGHVQIGTWQLSLLLDVIETARVLGESSCSIEIPENFDKEFQTRVKDKLLQYHIKNDSYCRDLFDTSKMTGKKGIKIGLVLEPYSFWSSEYRSLSFLGTLLTSGAGRSLNDAGYSIVPLNLPTLIKEGLPKASELPLLVLSSGYFRVDRQIADNFRKYLKEGGKLIWIGGDDPFQLTGAIAANFRVRENEEIPVSTKWGLQNENVLDKMVITFDGSMKKVMGTSGYKYYKNPNIDGFEKPRCRVSIDLAENVNKSSTTDHNPSVKSAKVKAQPVTPLAWLDNGREKFCIAAATKNVVWLPEYLVSPYILSEDDKVGYFPQMRLDSFGRRVILEAARYLLEDSNSL